MVDLLKARDPAGESPLAQAMAKTVARKISAMPQLSWADAVALDDAADGVGQQKDVLKDAIAAKVQAAADAPPMDGLRRAKAQRPDGSGTCQTLLNPLGFLTQSLFDQLSTPDTISIEAYGAICQLYAQLGIRNPDEQTKKMAIAVLVAFETKRPIGM